MASSEVLSAPLPPPPAANDGAPRETQLVDSTVQAAIEVTEPEKAAEEPECANTEPGKVQAEPEKAETEHEKVETDAKAEGEPDKADAETEIAELESEPKNNELGFGSTEAGETKPEHIDVEPENIDVEPAILEDVAASVQLVNGGNVDAPAKPDDATAPMSAQLESVKDKVAADVVASSPNPPEPKKIKPKSASKPASHPSYAKMISEAIIALQEKSGSSQHAIAKSIEEKHKLALTPNFRKILAIQLKRLSQNGQLVKVKNSYKLSSKAKKGKNAKKAGTPAAVHLSMKKPNPNMLKSKSPSKAAGKTEKRKASMAVKPQAKKPKTQSKKPQARKPLARKAPTEKVVANNTEKPKALTEKAKPTKVGKTRASKAAEPPTSSKETKPKDAKKEPSTSTTPSSVPTKGGPKKGKTSRTSTKPPRAEAVRTSKRHAAMAAADAKPAPPAKKAKRSSK